MQKRMTIFQIFALLIICNLEAAEILENLPKENLNLLCLIDVIF